MKKEKILDALQDLADKIGVRVRQEKGDFAGGLCVKDDTQWILLNKRHMIDRRINVLARELTRFDLTGHDLPKAVRDIIDSERKNATQDELELTDVEE